MIFLTVGTHEPFDRLVRYVDNWCASRSEGPQVLGQITENAGYKPLNFRTVATLEPSEYQRAFREADFVVSHAGMGSIITALSERKRILILPRRGYLNETRNDHQFVTMEYFRDKPGIYVAEDEELLLKVLDQLVEGNTVESGGISPYASQELIDELSAFIDESTPSKSKWKLW